MDNLFVFDNPKDKQVGGGLLHSFWSSWSYGGALKFEPVNKTDYCSL
jgi:hypothetical protein